HATAIRKRFHQLLRYPCRRRFLRVRNATGPCGRDLMGAAAAVIGARRGAEQRSADVDEPGNDTSRGVARFRTRLRLLYHGHSAAALRFQIAILAVDLAIIVFFVATPLLRD